MQRATDRIVLHHVPGTLISGGKWHEVVSLLQAWSSFQKQQCGDSPAVRMESLLTVLVQEQQQQQAASGDCSINRTTTRSSNSTTTIVITMDLYNCILDAWACAALFGSMEHPELASQRAREILVALQENYERRQQEQNDGLEEISGTNNNDKESTTPQQQQQLSALKPNAKSFNLVLHAARKAEGVVVARRVLAWMEYLYKSGRNVNAKPGRSDYVQLLDAYGKQHHQREKSSHILHKRYAASVATTPAGVLTEAFLRHVQCQPQAMVEPHRLPDTVCYNIVIRAWTRQRRGRESAEHADRLLEEMKAERCERCQPNEITYGCKCICTKCIRVFMWGTIPEHRVCRVSDCY